MYQALYLKRDPMYVFLNLKFMYQIAGTALSVTFLSSELCTPAILKINASHKTLAFSVDFFKQANYKQRLKQKNEM